MPAPRLIYPMLDGFLLGDLISDHDGVRCYPAIRRNTDEKYIVKVISVPASQVQVDALLITGALSGREAAQEYFNRQAEDMVRQTETLRQLSHQEGFVPYLDAQIVPMETGVGCEVYLLGTYKHSVEKIFAGEAMTHLGVVHMALDLCAALAACRRAGFLYVDLQPGNIFYTEEHGYRIGDVGFLSLASLKFASLAQKYRSSYTAPEMADDFTAPNCTLDTYALGMILYQAYNGGVLPFEGNAPAELSVPPMYADYEMAEIIYKACAADPADRWQDPTQMAQAIVEYMQRNNITDSPIIPLPIQDEAEAEESVEEFLPEADPEELRREMEELEMADADELPFLAGLDTEDPDSQQNLEILDERMVSEDISDMLAQADELIDHPLPEPPVAPMPVHVPLPDPIVLDEPEPEEIRQSEPESEEEQPEPEQEPVPEPEEAAPEIKAEKPKKEKKEAPTASVSEDSDDQVDKPIFRFPWRIVAAAALVILIIVTVIIGGNYYNNQYLQHIDDLILESNQNTLTVQVVSEIDDSLLVVVCTDSYGNIDRQPLQDGVALFTNLTPQTHYTVRVEISGSHKLTGKTSETFSTPAQTQILTFTAGIGPEDGSVILNFTANGPKVDRWVVTYAADGVPAQTKEFSGNSTTITDLEIDKAYTFTLSDANGTMLTGQTQVSYTAIPILLAQDLQITACGGGILTVEWNQPTGYTVEKWTLHCYNADGYDRVITTADLSYTFTGLTHNTPCTVDIVAVGMSQSVHTTIRANPITVHRFDIAEGDDHQLHISWNYSGNAPAEGWILYASIDGSAQFSWNCNENSAVIPAIPGAYYTIQVVAADGVPVFGGSTSYDHSEALPFSAFGVHAEDLQWKLCLRPDGDSWHWQDVPEENFRTEFSVNQRFAFVIHTEADFESTDEAVHIQYVLHTSDGVLAAAENTSQAWNELWQDGTCQLDIPFSNLSVGSYTLTVYFNGDIACEHTFTII